MFVTFHHLTPVKVPIISIYKFSLQLYCNRTLAWVFSCKFAAYFQNTFSQEHLWMAASVQQFLTFCNSFLPLKYKKVLIHTLIHRYAMITSLSTMILNILGGRGGSSQSFLLIIVLRLGSLPPNELTYLLQWKPSKNDGKCFLFYLKSSFRSVYI